MPATNPQRCSGTATLADVADANNTSANYYSNGWFGGPNGLSEFARTLNGLSRGDVRGLCVVRTWMDDNRQYGPVSSMWASTAPLSGASFTSPVNPSATEDTNARTTRLDWTFQLDEGFEYEVGVASAAIDASGSDLSSCGDATSVPSPFASNSDNASDKYQHSALSTYTEYRACVRANSGSGMSSWTDLGVLKTLPAAPSGLSHSVETTTGATDTTQVEIRITWSFSTTGTVPKATTDYEVQYVVAALGDTST